MSIEPPTTAPHGTVGEPGTSAQGPAPTAPPPLRLLRPLVLRLHCYAGVFVAPFLLVAAVTGPLYAGSFQAEQLVCAHELTVPVGDHKLPISQQVAAARTAHPEDVAADHTLAVFVTPTPARCAAHRNGMLHPGTAAAHLDPRVPPRPASR